MNNVKQYWKLQTIFVLLSRLCGAFFFFFYMNGVKPHPKMKIMSSTRFAADKFIQRWSDAYVRSRMAGTTVT